MDNQEKKIPIVAIRDLSDHPYTVRDLMDLMTELFGKTSDNYRARKALEEVTEYAQAMHSLTIGQALMDVRAERLQFEADYELSDSLATILYCIKRRADKAGMSMVDAMNLLVKMAYDKISGRRVDPDYLREDDIRRRWS